MRLRRFCITFLLGTIPLCAQAQVTDTANKDKGELIFVVLISRHGVRSPTGKAAQYNVYSSAPWPKWEVQPGYLTRHGFHLMELFGAYDRLQFSREGLFAGANCAEAKAITIYADSDQRTHETGKALAQGMFPGCDVPVTALPEGTNDPLFHFLSDKSPKPDAALARAAIAGRLGGDPANLTTAYRTQLEALDTILASCGKSSTDQKRTSLFDIPATLEPGKGDHLADYRGPLSVASTLSENLLLEYAEGMDSAHVGWGCVDGTRLRSLIDLHTAAVDFTQRTSAVARVQSWNLLDHILRALQQAATQKPVAGAIAKPSDHALVLVGHDTNLENIAGLLNLTWIADGRRDDTPPGSAFVFQLWKDRKTGAYSVRVSFTTQTLEQMRLSSVLSLSAPPESVPLFVPGCSGDDLSCTWQAYSSLIHQVTDAQDITAKRPERRKLPDRPISGSVALTGAESNE